jgi:DNA sulfur modification protein DndE
MGSCLSLEEAKIPNPSEFAEEEREFNRYTLLSKYDVLYIALLR